MRLLSILYWKLNAIVSAPILYAVTVHHWANSSKTWKEANKPAVDCLNRSWNHVCAVCGEWRSVEYVALTDCNLCKKCRNDLDDSFEFVNRNRDLEEVEL